MKTIIFFNRIYENQLIVAYLDGLDLTPVPSPKGDGCLLAKVIALQELQSASEAPNGCDIAKQLRPLFGRTLTSSPCGMLTLSILDKAFKGEL